MTATTPRISIVIPAYNSEKYLSQTLEGVLAQTRTDWELVIIDDGSKDSTPEIARQYAARDARIRLVVQENAGVAAARNRGCEETNPQAPYLILLDNDDVWEPDALERMHDCLESDATACAVHGAIRFIDTDGKPCTPEFIAGQYSSMQKSIHDLFIIMDGRVIPRPVSPYTTFATLILGNCVISPGCVLIRRSMLPAPPVFDAEAVPADDWDLWLRLSRKANLLCLPDIVLNYRLHSSNASHNRKAMGNKTAQVFLRHTASLENSQEQQQMSRIARVHCLRQQRKERLSWTLQCFQQRKILDGLKHLRHYSRHSLGKF